MPSQYSIYAVLSLALACQLPPNQASGQDIDFSHEVVPILRKHCIDCHGGREAKGSFSLNTRSLLVESGHVDFEKAADSRLIELLKSTDADDQMPPKEKPRLTSEEIKLLEKWIASDLAWESGFSFAPQAYEPPLKPRRPELPPAIDNRQNPIDRILDNWMAVNEVQRPVRVDDAVYLRRVRLDLTGLLPEPAELDEFLADRATDKRAQKAQALLEDRITYADHWLSFYNDLLRNDYSGTGFITGGRKQISGWLYKALVDNKPFDALARELIAPTNPESQGYIDGIRWRGEVSAGQTVEIQFAQSVSQSFLGINLKCASCHDSFIDRWKLDEAYGLAAIYSERTLDIHRCDKPVGRTAQASWLFPEMGQVDPKAPRAERLNQLAALMTSTENGRFARTISNRLWYRMMGRGIVHPLDAMQTEPWNADLLDYLAVYLVDSKFDVKKLLALIAGSEAYQSRSEVVREAKEATYKYAGPRSRRLTAEQFLDAVWQITGTAPSKFDAPVFHSVADKSGSDLKPPEANWIWGKTENDPPDAGETIVLKYDFKLDSAPIRGGAIFTCDNEFRLFINGREADKGTEWTQLHSLPLHTLLKKGDNQIAAICKNAGNSPNAAGFYFACQLMFDSAPPTTILSDASWKWSAKVPNVKEGRLGTLAKDFQVARIVPTLGAWKDQIDPQASQLVAQLSSGELPMVRASLLKNNALMRSLGRPMREQIVSMRPTELTTLEAIDLANEAELSKAFSEGASKLVTRFEGDSKRLVDYLYQFALSRKPTPSEQQLLLESMGTSPSAETTQDVLWAIFMLPEFWLLQ
jgi:mono/diheme cytochrome c family protein